jgi:hypothetical protein
MRALVAGRTLLLGSTTAVAKGAETPPTCPRVDPHRSGKLFFHHRLKSPRISSEHERLRTFLSIRAAVTDPVTTYLPFLDVCHPSPPLA